MRSTALTAVLFANFVCLPAFAADKERINVGDEAPNFTAKTLNPDRANAKIFSLDSAVGPEASDKRKAVLISFTQASCAACVKELPFLAALYQEFRDKGLLVVSVVIDKEDGEVKKMSDALLAAKVDFPALNDRFNIVAKRYYIAKPPSLVIIDENGHVARVWADDDESVASDIISDVRKNLGLPVSEPVPMPLASFVRGGGKSTELAPVSDNTPEPEAKRQTHRRRNPPP